MSQLTIQQAFELALRHHQAGQLQQAEYICRQILAQQPGHPAALHFLGIIAHQSGRLDLAVDLIRQAVANNPNDADAYGNLGVALRDQGQLDAAVAAYRRAIVLKPHSAQTHYNLGIALRDQGLLDEAVAAYRQAIALKPDYADAHNNLGVALYDKGQLDEAMVAYRQAIAVKPDYAEAYGNLGVALKEQGQLEAAVAAFRQAITLKPGYAEAYSNLSMALRDSRQPDAAIAVCRQAIALNPKIPEAYNNLGSALKDQGLVDEAVAAFRQAVALEPGNARIHSNLIYTLHYHPACAPQAIAAEHRRWNLRHAEPLRRFIQPHANDRNPERRLRIGYVSPDFREHSVAPMVLPLLANHDHAQFEVFCYAEVEKPDGMTDRFRAQADHWRSTVGLSDAYVSDLIRQDQIDILVELAGHTAGSRLLVLARQPAPVQINRQGYPNTTGLTTIAYRMTDAYADPPGLSDTLHSEKLIRLPQTNWIYEPPANCPPPLERPAADQITFGCFNNFAKVTEPMLKLWARILAAVPHSRLMLKAMAFSSSDVQQRVRGIFQAEGLALERVELVLATRTAVEHLALYNQLDVALDPFPYHGTTTTCEALWMGVPVITLAGRTHVSRVGVSLLANVGLPELIADSPEAYIRIAVDLARDLPRLRNMQATLRPRMAQSPLLDAPRFARNIEAVYRQVWRQWCAESPAQDGKQTA